MPVEDGVPIRLATTNTQGKTPTDASGTPEEGQPLLNAEDGILYVMLDSSNYIAVPDSSSTVQDLSQVLTEGNSAGTNNIDVNSNDVMNVNNFDATSSATDNLSADANTEISVSDALAMNSNVISGLADASNPQEAATYSQLQAVSEGAHYKDPAVAAATGNIDLTSTTDPNPIDGVTLSANDRVLLKEQTDASQNGVYDAVDPTDPTSWVRVDDMNEDSEIDGGQMVFVEEGNNHANDRFAVTSNNTAVISNGEAVTFGQVSSLGQVTAGDALTKSGDTLNVEVSAPLNISSDQIELLVSSNLGTNASDQLEISSSIAGDGLTGADGSALDVSVSDFAGTFLTDDGSNNLQVDIADGLVDDGAGNIEVNATDLAGTGIAEDGSNDLEVNFDSTTGVETSSPNTDNPLKATADGVTIAIDNDSVVYDGNGAVAVGTVDGGTW